MLRRILILIPTLVLVATLIPGWNDGTSQWPARWASTLILAILVFENWRYSRPATNNPGPGWQKTAERFVDPETDKTVTVWFNPTTGERRYVSTR
jgi:hypothetical protein